MAMRGTARVRSTNDDGQAPTTVRLPAGHGGVGDSSPELLVDGEGRENRLGSGVFPMRWGYDGQRRSCDGEEGGEGELDAPRMKNGKRGLGSAHRGRARDGGGGRTATVSFGPGDGAVGTSAVGTGEARRRRQHGGDFWTAGRNGCCRDAGALSRQRT
jgi:hypothetical protein